ncbi:MAG TPA: hypothetical protein VLT34_06505 [Arthrobacter sp.]|nr:hypothetical protein [Arthrobacter sp.]
MHKGQRIEVETIVTASTRPGTSTATPLPGSKRSLTAGRRLVFLGILLMALSARLAVALVAPVE